MPRAALDVVRALGRRDAALGQQRRAAFVGEQPPAARRRLVDGAADERVAEAEAPRHVGRPDEVAAQQLVQRVDDERRVEAGRGGGQLGLERVARDRRAIERAARIVRQQRELVGQRRGDRTRHLDARERDAARAVPVRRPARRARELLEVERVAAALAVEHGGVVDAEQLARLRRRQRHEVEPRERAGALRALERAREPLGDLARPHGQRDQHAAGGRPPQQRPEQVDRPGVRPVQIVEQEDEWLRLASASSSRRAARYVR